MAGGRHRRHRRPKDEETRTMKPPSAKNSADKEWQKRTERAIDSKWAAVVLILIPLFFAIFFRVYPASLPATDDWAASTIQNNIIAQRSAELRQDYPLLPQAQIQQQAQQFYQTYAEQNADLIEQQQQVFSESFRDRLQLTLEKRDGTQYKQTYFLAIDPYYYLRRAENVIESGTVCDDIRDGECIDNRMLAPKGTRTRNDYHSHVSAWFGSISGWFGYQPMTGMFYLPAIFAAFSTIPVFLIVRRRYGNIPATIAALVLALHVVLLGRTPAGFVDTDIWSAFFPLFGILFVLLALDRRDRYSYLYIAGAGVTMALFSQFWAGWYFAFFILFCVILGVALFELARAFIAKYTRISTAEDAKALLRRVTHAATNLGVYLFVTGILISIIGNPATFFNAFKYPFGAATTLQQAVNPNLWPNVLTTVAELNVQTLFANISQLGGRFLFLISILGIFTFAFRDKTLTWKHWSGLGAGLLYYILMTTESMLRFQAGILTMWPFSMTTPVYAYFFLFSIPLIAVLFFSLIKHEHVGIHYGLFAIGWYVASLFATAQGVRFLIMIIPVFAISLGFAIGWILRTLPRILQREANVPEFFARIAVLLAVVIILFTPVHGDMFRAAHYVGMQQVPSMNDAWWDSLKAIEADSQPDAIITSWWDFGHWFKYVSDRRVTFDGASQTVPAAHWVGKLLLLSDPNESLGILRMLNCGQNDAFIFINEQTESNLASYRIITRLHGISRNAADALLQQEGFSAEQRERILQSTHCEPPESYLIVSADMVGKSGVWGHFGLWDFERAYVVDAERRLSRQAAIDAIARELGVSQEEAMRLYGRVQTVRAEARRNNEEPERAINTWVSTWPVYVGARSCQETEERIICNLNLNIGQQDGIPLFADQLIINRSNVSNSSITISAQGRVLARQSPGVIEVDGETYDLGGGFGLDIRIVNGRAIIAAPELSGGLFSRLFDEEDGGTYFSMLTKQTQLTGGKIIVYKVDWEAYKQTIGETYASYEGNVDV